MPYEDDYKMWLENMLIESNPDWVCDEMHDTEVTHDWCYKYCGKDDLYITPKCLHMYYHHIVRADRKTEPQRNMAEDIVESFGFKAESYRQAKAKTEPTGYNLLPVEDEPTISKMEQVDGECADCKWHDKEWWYIKCDGCSRLHSHFEPKDEPQTDCPWR